MAQDILFWLQVSAPNMGRKGEHVKVIDFRNAGDQLGIDVISQRRPEFLAGDMVVYQHPGDAEGKTRVGEVIARIHGLLEAAKDTNDTLDIILREQTQYQRLR